MTTIHPHETELVTFLQDPASYPHRPSEVRIVQTHISIVALAGPYVYKVKKPVDLGFLDFSTLAAREQDCVREVRLNRRFCSQIYEGVVPIRRVAGCLTFDGTGEPVEYAVKMKTLPPDGFLDRRLEAGTAGPGAIDRVAERLVDVYRAQTPTPEVAAWGRVARLRVSTDENTAQTEPLVGAVLPRVTLETIRAFNTAYYACFAALLEGRGPAGCILDCHGDLRAEHVHLSDDGVCIFDAITFNDRFRYIDVASDVAFLAMDLRRLGRPSLSRRLVRKVSDALGDVHFPRLVPFYACYRAYVRGKVELLRSAEAEVPPEERAASEHAARQFFQLALTYAVEGEGPVVVVVMGPVGTGKSTVAGALGEVLGWPVVSSDRLRKGLAGVPLDRRGDDAERARLYSAASTARTYGALTRAAVENARAGRSTILDATCSRRRHRDALRGRLVREGIPCVFVELAAPEEVVRTRLVTRARRGGAISDARLEDLERLTARYETPDPDEEVLRVAAPAAEDGVRAILDELVARRLAADAEAGVAAG